MGFIIRDNSFLYVVILNIFISLYLAIQGDILIACSVIILSLIIALIKYKHYKQTNTNHSENLSLEDISLLVPYLPINLAITDKNDNQIATNIKNRMVLETIDMSQYCENLNININLLNPKNDMKIIKVKVDNTIKQYFTYKESIKNKNAQTIGYANIELDITALNEYLQKIIERNKMLEFFGTQLEMQMSNEVKNRLEKQRSFQDLLDNNKDGILIFAYNCSNKQVLGYIDSNSIIKNILYGDKKDLSKLNIYDLLHISEKERVEAILQNMVNEKPILFETLMLDKNRVFPVEINAHLCKVYNQDCIYLSIRDITLRKELEAKRDKNRIIAIKDNKIGLVVYLLHILFARIYKATKNINEQANIINNMFSNIKDETQEIVDYSEFINKTIKDLIAFYTPANIKTYVNIKSLLETIQQTIFFKEIINNTIITIIQKGDVKEVYCDEDAIKYVLITIINNSLKSIDINKGTNFYGKIDITIEELSNYVLISIEDNAGGIDNSIIGRVFDAFYPTRNHSTGLGLPTCKVLVEEILFGKINIMNINEGVKIDIQIAK
ncbi:hypothetical protein CCY99_02050 [Helicobacter sp. 16-1353]|uniref:ATP-binding protein n=1 Tax=Helicobacter sp. 16-1353 TaxID=2004996 RepID=UPI000DCB11A5|nr:ATP-binding protein [Helicobacter sp. 16-1353]RAX54947.1 hypothetical protein CCY99_02050 [Helicobacter sp. 16-1353]